MKNPNLSRRNFGKLTAAALGGALLGASQAGCNSEKPAMSAQFDPTLLLQEPHVCKGLNSCQGQGKGGDNACAGQGTCATAEAHSCKGENACKGQGGCGAHAGQNACKGQGDCSVPVHEGAWKSARQTFEQLMAKAGKEVGPAPK
jgi:hypothetical protein